LPGADKEGRAFEAALRRAQLELSNITIYSGAYELTRTYQTNHAYSFLFRLVDVPDASVSVEVSSNQATVVGGWFPLQGKPSDNGE
jgi:hypothetical protein